MITAFQDVSFFKGNTTLTIEKRKEADFLVVKVQVDSLPEDIPSDSTLWVYDHTSSKLTTRMMAVFPDGNREELELDEDELEQFNTYKKKLLAALDEKFN